MLLLTTFSAKRSSMYFWIALLRGLAPYFLSKPFSLINAFAALVSEMLYPSLSTLLVSLTNSISTICSMSFFSSELKMTISSIRLRNSGAKVFFNAFWITPFSISLAWDFMLVVSKPTPVPKSFTCLAPILEVIIIMVFWKLILRPKLSVKNPSSNTWRSILKTSGCAFSTSSSKITE